MSRSYILLTALALCVTHATEARDSEATAPNTDAIPLPQEHTDLTPDPAVKWGLLENGMRYAILKNSEPPQRASLRLYVDAGSLQEADDQQGLAHFLEHMAFNGTKNFPAGEMVEYFQRLGMGFGNHTNAHTSFNETVYKLELPGVGDELLDEGFKLLRDYADGMLLLQEEIEDERGIILNEKRARDSVGWRTFVEQIKFALPENRISRRMPIGDEEVIKTASRERFEAFYRDWYTPNRMALVVVGDVENADAVEALLKTHFDSLAHRDKKPSPPLGNLTQRGLVTHFHHEPEAGETSVSIETVIPRVDPPDNLERRAYELKLAVASHIINRRLDRIAKQDDAPISKGSATATDFYNLNFALYASIDASCKPENWKEALSLIEQELRRAIEYGFTSAEFAEATSSIRQTRDLAAKQAASRKSSDLANQLAREIGSRRVFTHPSENLANLDTFLTTLTVEQCHEAYQELWKAGQETMIFVSGNAELGDSADQTIRDAHEASRQTEVVAPEEEDIPDFQYTKLPHLKGEELVMQDEYKDLGVSQLRFKNNVRVNLKVTDFETDTVQVKVRIGSGRITEPSPGLASFLSNTFVNGGLEGHSHDELVRIFASKTVGAQFAVDTDAFVLAAQTTPEDLEDQLLLLRAYITNPGYRTEALTEFRRTLDHLYQQLDRTPEGVMQSQVPRFLHGGDLRFGFPDRATVEALTMDQAKAWLQPELEKGYLEITLVGAFDQNEAQSLLTSTFGSLPERDAVKPDYTKEREVHFPAATTNTIEFDSSIPRAMILAHWPTLSLYEIHRTRRLGLLAAVLDDRLRVKIREELGDAYSPGAHNAPSDTWKDFGYTFAYVMVDPDKAQSVLEVVSEIAADLATGTSITEDELERAKLPQLTQIGEMRRTNRYWMSSVLEASHEYPQSLDWARSFVEDYQSATVDELNALAKEFYQADKQVNVIIAPRASAADQNAADNVNQEAAQKQE